MKKYFEIKQKFCTKLKKANIPFYKLICNIVFFVPDLGLFIGKMLLNKSTPWQAKVYVFLCLLWQVKPKGKYLNYCPKVSKKQAFYNFCNAVCLIFSKTSKQDIINNWHENNQNLYFLQKVIHTLKLLTSHKKLNPYKIIKIITKKV